MRNYSNRPKTTVLANLGDCRESICRNIFEELANLLFLPLSLLLLDFSSIRPAVGWSPILLRLVPVLELELPLSELFPVPVEERHFGLPLVAGSSTEVPEPPRLNSCR